MVATLSFIFGLSVGAAMLSMASSLSLLGGLLCLSVITVVGLGVVASFWYACMLFLVYVGSLLVLFLYISMLSSNKLLSFRWGALPLGLCGSGFCVFLLNSPAPKGVVGGSCFDSGGLLPVPVLLGLGVLLLVVFLGVVEIIRPSGGAMRAFSGMS
uniref:NADH dehydrogenase subunit 6 n=1 Tax=Myosotella myosotis TaxID=252580 RepID=B3DFE7_9EUPU|nr:NADH dehydrogenase subunit 6 [Myosotella myosotis]ACE62834.1 NADH dehydrogenase subunit 6 [Myosotella myosotis]